MVAAVAATAGVVGVGGERPMPGRGSPDAMAATGTAAAAAILAMAAAAAILATVAAKLAMALVVAAIEVEEAAAAAVGETAAAAEVAGGKGEEVEDAAEMVKVDSINVMVLNALLRLPPAIRVRLLRGMRIMESLRTRRRPRQPKQSTCPMDPLSFRENPGRASLKQRGEARRAALRRTLPQRPALRHGRSR